MGKVAKGVGAASAVPAAGVGGQLAVFAMFLNWLKGMMAAMAAAAMNLMAALWLAVVTATNMMAGFALTLGAAVASALGGAVSAVTGAVASIGAAALALVSLVAGSVYTVQENNATAQRDALPLDCRPMTEATVREIDDNTQSAADTAAMEETAQQVYSILAGMGMQDENIAGVLGNFQQESLLDPTTVETIYTEPYRIGPLTREAEENGFKVELINADYAAMWPAIDLVGIGLGQWTNDRNTMLTEYADETDGEWWEIETQFGFMLSADDPRRVQFVKDLIADAPGSVEGSTRDWMVEWEGLTLNTPVNQTRISERQEYAAVWFAKMGSWEANEDLANSILEQTQVSVSVANENRRSAVMQECRTANVDGGNDEVVQAGEQIPCDSLGSMHPDACHLHDHLQEKFGGFFLSAGGQRNEPGSNHDNGQAIDYMMAPSNKVPTEEMYDSGTTIVNYLIPRAEEFNIKGILWDGRVWSIKEDPVGPWNNETTRDASGRGSNTQNHIDHFHISVGPDRFM
ncbi:phage tail tip lysozyme [Nocardiopsis synnemataformans]|uniref:phage tail tip lysozyme n=1 Tax=Nocardiopsis synnemataformans TaxID=61305 RepID=UPI003EBC5E77